MSDVFTIELTLSIIAQLSCFQNTFTAAAKGCVSGADDSRYDISRWLGVMLQLMLMSSLTFRTERQLMFPRSFVKSVSRKTSQNRRICETIYPRPQTCLFMKGSKARALVNEHESVYLQFSTVHRQCVAKSAASVRGISWTNTPQADCVARRVHMSSVASLLFTPIFPLITAKRRQCEKSKIGK